MRNTLAISGLQLLFGFPAPIILAILFNELRNIRLKRTIQTISYLPHFISWVIAASLLFSILNSEGMLNRILISMGIIKENVNWLSVGKYFWPIITVANIWKSVGFSSIIYLSAIAGIDSELYQAGAVDGLGRFGQIWHVTLPGIRTTIILLGILQIGGILNAGFQQQLLLGNDMTRSYYEVIDTYAYKYGVQLGNYSYGTAVGLMKGIVSVALVFSANAISRKAADTSVL
jgi:putative aldouronate transport system permease protein